MEGLLGVRPRPWLRALAALGLAAAGLRAAERPSPTLAFLDRPAAGTQDEPGWTGTFHAAVLRDFRRSGAFRVLDGAGEGSVAPASGKAAGADLLVRTTARTLASGKLAMTCECIELRTQAVLVRKIFVGEAKALDSLAHRLAGFVIDKLAGRDAVPAFVFSRPLAGGIREIFGADPDGAHVRQLTTLKTVSDHPAVSRDGKLAFVTYVSGPPQIWGQTRPGGPLGRLFPRGAEGGLGLRDLAWSPDGTRLAFAQADRKGGSAIVVLDVATGRAVQVTGPGQTATGPSWNPAGSALAYVSDRDGLRQVYTIGADGRDGRRLTSDDPPKACAAWSPSGDRIAVAAAAGGGSSLFTMAPDGGDRRPVPYLGGAVASLAWSPRGGRLLVGVARARNTDLCLLDPDGSIRSLAAAGPEASGLPGIPALTPIVFPKAERSAFQPGAASLAGSLLP